MGYMNICRGIGPGADRNICKGGSMPRLTKYLQELVVGLAKIVARLLSPLF